MQACKSAFLSFLVTHKKVYLEDPSFTLSPLGYCLDNTTFLIMLQIVSLAS